MLHINISQSWTGYYVERLAGEILCVKIHHLEDVAIWPLCVTGKGLLDIYILGDTYINLQKYSNSTQMNEAKSM